MLPLLCLLAQLVIDGPPRLPLNGGGTTGGGGGGPTLIASDNFDSYSDQEALDSTSNWTTLTGTLNINKPAGDGSIFPGATAIGIAYFSGASFNADQRAEITIDSAAAGGNFDWIGPAVRVQSGANTCYGVVFSSTDLYLISISAGTQATIMSDTGMTLAAGNRIAIECAGVGAAARLKVQVDTGSGWVDKWVNINPAVDIDGGSAGICSWLLSSSLNRLDDWKGYNL